MVESTGISPFEAGVRRRPLSRTFKSGSIWMYYMSTTDYSHVCELTVILPVDKSLKGHFIYIFVKKMLSYIQQQKWNSLHSTKAPHLLG